MTIKNNKYIPSEDKDFFILLRVGLWQKVEEELSLCPDWSYIYQLACEQTVHGIVADGIGLYRKEHPDLNISQEQNDRFLSSSAQIVRRNFAINQLQARVCKLLNEQEVKYVILKGQGIAQYYPKPNLRCSGDIDILCPEKHYPYAIDLLKKVADSSNLHEDRIQRNADFFFGDREIELHLDELFYIGRNKMNRFAELREQMFKEGKFRTYKCNGTDIQLPLATFDCFYLFAHFVKHYYGQGLGLRQLCDWVMFLEANKDSINLEEVKTNLKSMNLDKFWNDFLTFAELYLGLDISINHKPSTINLKKIWRECKKTGNFGHKRDEETNAEREKVADSFIGRNLLSWKMQNKKFCHLLEISPSLAMTDYWRFISMYFNVALKKLHIK